MYDQNTPPPPPPTGGEIYGAPDSPVPSSEAQGYAPPPPTPQSAPEVPGPEPEVPSAPPPNNSRKKLLKILAAVAGVVVVLFVILNIIGSRSGPKVASITWWGLWEDNNIVSSIISEYESSHPGIKINYIKQSQKDYRERLVNAMAQGQAPDIFRFHNTWVPMLKTNLDAVPANVYNASDFAETFYPVATTDLTSGAGIVGIPLEYDALTLYINDDIFTKAGKEPPKTWDDVRTTALELTVKDERGIITQSGVAMGRTENVDHWPEVLGLLMLQNHANPANPTSDLAAKALQYYAVFSTVDGVWDQTLPPSTQMFASGKLAMYFAPSWRAFEIQAANPNLKFHTVALPQVPKDQPGDPDVSYATYWAEGVWSKSKNKDASWEFLKYMSSKNTLERLYQNASQTRGFGEPYSRVDMSGTLVGHPVVGSIIDLAPYARSWFLADRTWDGPTGINSQINKYYENAINGVNKGQEAVSVLKTAAAGIAQVLAQYQGGK